MTWKKIVGVMHLWLGMSSGMIIFVVGLTGCIWVFEEEITHFIDPTPKVALEAKPYLLPSQLASIAQKYKAGQKITYVEYQKGEPVRIGNYNKGANFTMFLNPYSGEVLKTKEKGKDDFDFFRFVLNGHRFLWFPYKIGRPIVNYATLTFVVILITGLVLWWPKNKSAAKQRFWFKWKKGTTQWKRKNYDLHNIMGFYAMFFLLAIALTGMVWGLEWYSKGLYWATSGGKSLTNNRELVSDTLKVNQAVSEPLDKIWLKLSKENPNSYRFYISMPDKNTATIYASVGHEEGVGYKYDSHLFDQYTLQELGEKGPYSGKYQQATTADKLRRMNYDIHVGSILGLPGKILAFFASFTCASLPITGVYIWWGRRKKEKKSAKKSDSSTVQKTSVKMKRPIEAVTSTNLDASGIAHS